MLLSLPLHTCSPSSSLRNLDRADAVTAVSVVAVAPGRWSSRRRRLQVPLVTGYPFPHGIELRRHEIEPASRSSPRPTEPPRTAPPPPTVSSLPEPERGVQEPCRAVLYLLNERIVLELPFGEVELDPLAAVRHRARMVSPPPVFPVHLRPHHRPRGEILDRLVISSPFPACCAVPPSELAAGQSAVTAPARAGRGFDRPLARVVARPSPRPRANQEAGLFGQCPGLRASLGRPQAGRLGSLPGPWPGLAGSEAGVPTVLVFLF